MNAGMQLMKETPGLEAGARVVLGRLLAADGQIVDQDLGAAPRSTSVTSAGRRSATTKLCSGG